MMEKSKPCCEIVAARKSLIWKRNLTNMHTDLAEYCKSGLVINDFVLEALLHAFQSFSCQFELHKKKSNIVNFTESTHKSTWIIKCSTFKKQ